MLSFSILTLLTNKTRYNKLLKKHRQLPVGVFFYTNLTIVDERVYYHMINFTYIPDKAFYYCTKVKDRPEVRQFITDSFDAYRYCRFIKDRPEVRKYITDSEDAYFYCRHVKDRPSIRKRITDSEGAYYYCRFVKDSPEVRKHITKEEHLKNYREWKNKQ